jgi:hypothetical protein
LKGSAGAEPLPSNHIGRAAVFLRQQRKVWSRGVVALQYLLDVFIAVHYKSFTSQAATDVADARADASSAKEIEMAKTNEDPLAATGEDPVVETSKASVAETRKAAWSRPGKIPVAETREGLPGVMGFENPQKLENGGVEASAASSFAGSFQMFAAEATDYWNKSLESGSAFIEKLCGAKSLESAIQIQSDYAKSAYAEFVAYLVKMSDLYCNLFKQDSKPIEKAAAKT